MMKSTRQESFTTVKRKTSRITGHYPGALLSVLILIVFWAHPLHGEIIYLKSGDAIIGKVSGQNNDVVYVKVAGKYKKIKKREIQSIKHIASDREVEDVRIKKSLEEMEEQSEIIDTIIEKRRTEHRDREEQVGERLEDEKEFFKDEILELKERKRKGALYRSLLWPGWGQVYKNEQIKGFGVMGVALLSAGGATYGFAENQAASIAYQQRSTEYAFLFYNQHNILYAYQNYDASVALRDRMNTSAVAGKALAGTAVLLYLGGIIDAYWSDVNLDLENEFTFQNRGMPNRRNASVHLSASPDAGPIRPMTSPAGRTGICHHIAWSLKLTFLY